MPINAVSQLRQVLKANSTKPFNARGSKTVRCEECLLQHTMCICADVKQVKLDAAFCLIMYKTEPLKPSNTGKLIADVVADTFAFLWSRTEPSEEMLALLNDPQWQPYVIFPEEGVAPERVTQQVSLTDTTKRPLFILLDGTWREAKKMFRKSPWLNQFPVLSFAPETVSNYQMRSSYHDHHICTAEVAVMTLELIKAQSAADALEAHFIAFRKRYMANKTNHFGDFEKL
ncbi:tRNA-uridine aminocarboxypropyltransferase [Flocculibacter collagenilyticus]|uniref:tRNA-uridine aminocarboxypropyltransferase n=1 Tax=Flocculibacter collagenilyticus TaxID=2744479 RepID=UPI0018F4D517|nr:tRNA-uridine aminocarboxypropyltransferase [Flocculibacter collagenilyticus]